MNQQAGYSCKCQDGYSGDLCEGVAHIFIDKARVLRKQRALWSYNKLELTNHSARN